MATPSLSSSARGQTIVIVAVGMVALVGAVGLVIDVGLAWAFNRGAQNGSDAAAHAGAVVIMEKLADPASTNDDAAVLAAIEAMADETSIALSEALYTDWTGDPDPIGVEVGSGGDIPPGAQGVKVIGERIHETLLAPIVGVNQIPISTTATAVTGPAEDPCPAGSPCALLPVTVPNTQVTCDGQNKSVPTTDPWDPATEYIVPLCGLNAGSVGWIDWTPTAGGVSELAAEICTPNPPDIDLPDWFYVTSTGNTNASSVQTCLEQWLNKVILIPLFDDWCRTEPPNNDPCTDPQPPSGVNQWYHFPSYGAFFLTGVYIQGNHSATCDPGGGNGATSCLTGRFQDTSIVGTVGEYTGPPPAGSPPELFAVQLVR
jgi:hypothetical protein